MCRQGTPFQRIEGFARRHGVTVRVVPRIPPQFEAPFTDSVGISWRNFALYVLAAKVRRAYTLGAMIHELGHLLATKKAPNVVHEWDFTGWEWRVAISLGVRQQWDAAMSEYGTKYGVYEELNSRERVLFLRESVAHGREVGNIGPSGRPLVLRRTSKD